MTHIRVSKLIIIGSDDGLSPVRRQAITFTNAVPVLIRTLGTNFIEILSKIIAFSQCVNGYLLMANNIYNIHQTQAWRCHTWRMYSNSGLSVCWKYQHNRIKIVFTEEWNNDMGWIIFWCNWSRMRVSNHTRQCIQYKDCIIEKNDSHTTEMPNQ